MRRSEQLRGLLVMYLVLLGCIPFLDGLTHAQSPEGFHPRHNVQLGWKLMHVAPAMVGIGIAASLVRWKPEKAFPALAILALQIVLAFADYWRVGFNSMVSREFLILDYLVPAVALGVPFAIWALYSSLRGQRK